MSAVFETAHHDGYRTVIASHQATETNPAWSVARQESLFNGINEVIIKADVVFDSAEPHDREQMFALAAALLDILAGAR
jgi:hypothetical protein